MTFTIFGATGAVGSALLEHLRAEGHECVVPARDEIPEGRNLGRVFYCIGLTADFRHRLADTVQAHVCHFMEVLTRCTFERICYLSSTRVYAGCAAGLEDARSIATPLDPSDLYNLSKLLGESACLHVVTNGVVVRLSNVFDPRASHARGSSQNFLSQVLREATSGRVVLGTHPDSAKDYVLLQDVVEVLPKIALAGRHRIYNLAGGRNVSHRQIVERLGCVVEVQPDAPRVVFPVVSVERLRHEFGFEPRSVLDSLRPQHHAGGPSQGS